MQFKKAARQQAKLRLAMSGPAGSGKTWGAIQIAIGLGGPIGIIDTERGSASLYAHLTDFDTLELNPPYHPKRFIEALHAAEKAGFNVVIIDSISHEWNGSGGCLDINDKLANSKYKGNTWAAWSEVTPMHREFLDAVIQSPVHIIATLRSKTETVQEGGKVKKIGMKSETRDGSEYEFTTVLNISHDTHLAVAEKDRTGLFSTPQILTPDTGKMLLNWLNSGAAPTPREANVPAVPSPESQPDAPASPPITEVLGWIAAVDSPESYLAMSNRVKAANLPETTRIAIKSAFVAKKNQFTPQPPAN